MEFPLPFYGFFMTSPLIFSVEDLSRRRVMRNIVWLFVGFGALLALGVSYSCIWRSY